jgi:hypothetical protein
MWSYRFPATSRHAADGRTANAHARACSLANLDPGAPFAPSAQSLRANGLFTNTPREDFMYFGMTVGAKMRIAAYRWRRACSEIGQVIRR